MGAEPPTRIRGGAVLGGIGGSRPAEIGPVTEYVLRQAPCRVLLTAPHDDGLATRGSRSRRLGRRRPTPPSAYVDPPHVRPHRRRRPGRLLAGADDAPRRPRGLLPRRGPRVARAARDRARAVVGGHGRSVHGRHRARDRGAEAAGIERADVFVASTDGDNTNIVIAQIAKRRFNVPTVIARILDPYRAKWYEEQGLHTICPTRVAIDMLESEVRLAAARSGNGSRPTGGVDHEDADIRRWPSSSRCTSSSSAPARSAGTSPRELLEKGHEVTLIENNRERYLTVEQELEHNVQYGDASELWVLERAGISRADMVIAVTGDDEDNMLICQVGEGEVPGRPDHRPGQQPAQPRALRAARDQAAGLGHRPDPAPDRARGARVRPRPPARPARAAARDHRDAAAGRLAGGRPAGRRPADARGQPADLGAARGAPASCPAPTRCSRPGDEILAVLDPTRRGGPDRLLRARRVSDPSRRWQRREVGLPASSAAGWRRPTAPRSCDKRGRGLDPARRPRAGAALRAPAAVEGVPARRGRARGRLRQPAGVVRGERGRAANADERDVARPGGADGEAAGRGGGRVRARRCSPPARTSTSCGSRAPSSRGSTTCARSATPTRSARRPTRPSTWS